MGSRRTAMADKDNNEMSADEFDDNVDSDVANEIIDEGDDNDELPEDHTKMVAFHTAIKAVLERQLEKMQGEVRETGRLVSLGVEETEEAARKLHDEQKKLVLEEEM